MKPLLGNLKKGFLIVVSAPAGTGKTTLVHMLIKEFSDVFVQSISCTTRLARPGEIDGKDYVFLTQKAFEDRIQKGAFIEHATVFGHHYGTLKETVSHELETGKHVLLVIDTQGAMKLKKMLSALFIFVAPPSLETLEERLKHRQTESKQVMEERLNWAEKEMSMAKNYDYLIVNDELKQAYQVLKSIIIAEEHKIRG